MAQGLIYPFYIFFALAPSIIWLLFYLRKDSHPEPNRMVLKIFLCGMLIAIPTAFLELGILREFSKLSIPSILILFLNIFVGIALVEEIFKYLVIKLQVLKSPEFDEPVDAMIYMIIAGLGFAALENLLILWPEAPFQIMDTCAISGLRFIGATFLHALCSGLIGYFLALSFFDPKKRFKLVTFGLIIATALHGLYNLSIISMGNSIIKQNNEIIVNNFPLFISSIISLIIILTGLAVFVSWGFKQLKKHDLSKKRS